MSPALDPEERRRRRALLKAHHPDLGGDPEQFIRTVAAFAAGRSHPPAPPRPGDEVRFVPRARGLARLTAWATRRRDRRRRAPRVI